MSHFQNVGIFLQLLNKFINYRYPVIFSLKECVEIGFQYIGRNLKSVGIFLQSKRCGMNEYMTKVGLNTQEVTILNT